MPDGEEVMKDVPYLEEEDKMKEVKEAKVVVQEISQMMATSVESTRDLKFHVGYIVKAIGELRDSIKNPPVREIDVDVRKHLKHLSKIAFFPFNKLADL